MSSSKTSSLEHIKLTDAAIGSVLKEKVFLKFRKIHTRIPVTEFRPATLLEKRLWHRFFPVSFAKFLRTPLQNTSGGCFWTDEIKDVFLMRSMKLKVFQMHL